MNRVRFWPLMALLAACSGTSGDSAEIEAGIRIVSPDNGDWFDIGEEVSLEAEAWQVGGDSVELTTATWEVDGWTGEGNPLLTSDLPAGNLILEVYADVAGETLNDSVEIAVWAR